MSQKINPFVHVCTFLMTAIFLGGWLSNPDTTLKFRMNGNLEQAKVLDLKFQVTRDIFAKTDRCSYFFKLLSKNGQVIEKLICLLNNSFMNCWKTIPTASLPSSVRSTTSTPWYTTILDCRVVQIISFYIRSSTNAVR